jgi:hypothetical protein
LRNRGQSSTHRRNITEVGEGGPNGVLGSGERKVTDEEGRRRGSREGVVEGLLGALGLSFTVRAGSRKVDLDRTSVDFLSSEFESFLSSLGRRELDVSETTRSTRVTVGDDTGRDDLAALGELGLEPVVVDVPRELSDEDGGRLGSVVSVGVGDGGGLGLLSGGLRLLSSALLGLLSGGLGGHLLVLVIGRVGGVGVGRVGRILLGGNGSGLEGEKEKET